MIRAPLASGVELEYEVLGDLRVAPFGPLVLINGFVVIDGMGHDSPVPIQPRIVNEVAAFVKGLSA